MKTGLLGRAGQAVERQATTDIAAYFSVLAEIVLGLGLEKLVAHPVAQARDAVHMQLHNVLRKARPQLFMALATNLQLAYVTGFAQDIPVEADQQNLFAPLDFLGPSGQAAADYAAENAAELVTGIDQVTEDKIAEAIAQGIENELGVPGTSQLLRSVLEDMSTTRARMIATTEMNKAFSTAAVDKLGRLGIGYKQVILAPDPCPVCEENAGEDPLPLDETYSSGDSYPPFHPNCRCTIVGARGPEE